MWRRRIGPLIRGAQGATCHRQFSTHQAESLQVYVLDPKILFSHAPDQKLAEIWKTRETGSSAAPYVPVTVPRSFLNHLSDGQFQLGDMDNPGNSWVFGEDGELFEQRLLGSHTIESGFTSIITAEAFNEIQHGPKGALQLKLPSWEQFKQIVYHDDVKWPHPQLQPLIIFAGHMIESDTGSVYRNPASGSHLAGLTISTSSEEVD